MFQTRTLWIQYSQFGRKLSNLVFLNLPKTLRVIVPRSETWKNQTWICLSHEHWARMANGLDVQYLWLRLLVTSLLISKKPFLRENPTFCPNSRDTASAVAWSAQARPLSNWSSEALVNLGPLFGTRIFVPDHDHKRKYFSGYFVVSRIRS